MSYKDIKEARAKRATKEVIKGKGKRGRKRESATLEADELETEPEPKVARAAKEVINGRGKRGQKRKSAVQEVSRPPYKPPHPTNRHPVKRVASTRVYYKTNF